MGITLRWRDPACLSVDDWRRAARRRLPELAWMRDRWRGRLYVKGVLDVVSKNGGRQLDRTLATVDALPAIAARVGSRGDICSMAALDAAPM